MKSKNYSGTLINEAVFEEVFKAHYSPLVVFCLRITGIPELAEEIVQDCFVRIWEKRDQIDIQVSLKAYLYNSVRNTAFNYLKSLYHRNTVSEEGLPETDAGQSFDDTEYKELVELVNKSIDSLPEKTAIVFKMSRFGGLSNKEIADALSLSLKTVEYHMTIALKSLRKSLVPYLNNSI